MKKNANISRKKSSMRRAKIRFIAVSLSAVAALSLSGIFTRINAESVSERMIPCVRTIEPLREEETLHQMPMPEAAAKKEETEIAHDALKADEMHGEAARKANAEGGRLRMLIDDFRDTLQDESDFVKKKAGRMQKRMTWQSMGSLMSDSPERAVLKSETML
ncbi:MAG: hypothetical protein II709_06455 [Ruminococcus sp.]|nr:hypothetical protein [Ruminococcus sp.]